MKTLLGCTLVALALLPSSARAGSIPVTVLYFDNDTGDKSLEYLGKGLADMMITDLSNVAGVQIVEREKLESLLKELKLQRGKYFDPKTAQRIGKGVGAEFAVAGSFTAVEPNLRLDVRVIQIATGKVVRAHQVAGRKDAFFDLQQQLVEHCIAGLAVTLSAAEKSRVDAAVQANRVDDMKTAVEYSNALDSRDRGDLQAASQSMQKVMQGAPGFQLARTRYLQMMKDLYAAKDTRGKELSSAERGLVDDIEKHLAVRALPPLSESNTHYFGWRTLKSQWLLLKIGAALDQPSRAYLANVRAYVDNQQKLVAELMQYQTEYLKTHDTPWFPDGALGLSDEEAPDRRTAEQLGIRDPGQRSFLSAVVARQDLAALLMFGTDEAFDLPLKRRVCLYKIDPSFAKLAVKLLDDAADDAIKHDKGDPEHAIRVLQQAAQTYLVLGKPEDAIAKLQSALSGWPKAASFAETEKMLRGILDGSVKARKCEDPK
jgi:TolB-like protein